MYKSIIILGLINLTKGVPLFFFSKKHKNIQLTNTSKNKTDYINVPVRRYNNSLLITLMIHDLAFVYPDTIKYVYKKDKLA